MISAEIAKTLSAKDIAEIIFFLPEGEFQKLVSMLYRGQHDQCQGSGNGPAERAVFYQACLGAINQEARD